MNLAKKIKTWQKKGLISMQQGRAIIAYEKRYAKPYLFYGLMAVAMFCIGLGIISVIAANWAAIPPFVKLTADFMLLMAAGGAAWKFYGRGKGVMFEVFSLTFAILILASIGLIAQIYQLQPSGLSAFLLWSVLVMPMMFFNRKMTLPFIVLPVFWVSLLDYVEQNENLSMFLRLLTDSWEYSVGIIWLFLWFLIYQFLRLSFPGRAFGVVKALRFWLIFDVAVAVFFMDFERNFLVSSLLPYHIDGFLGVSLVALAAVMIGLSFYLERIRRRPGYIPFLMLIIFAGGLLPLSFLLSFALLALTGVYAYQNRSRRLLNLVFALAALRIFLIYADFWGSLMQTGVGLIISGVVLLLLMRTASWLTKRLQGEK